MIYTVAQIVALSGLVWSIGFAWRVYRGVR